MSATRNLRYAQVACACIWCLFSAGIVFGFAALKPILISEGVYHELCDPEDVDGLLCTAQDLKLNFIFALSATVTNIMALPVGKILDMYGPRVCGITGSGLLFLACGNFISAKHLTSIWDPYLVGYTLLAVAGPFVFISCFQLANSFPQRSGTILALLTGSFDSSSALFLMYRLLYQNWYPNLRVSKFFTVYLVVPLFILICQLTIMPHSSYKTVSSIAKIAVEGLDENGRLIEGDTGSNIIPDVQERQSLITMEEGEEDAMPNSPPRPQRRKSALETYVEGKLQKKSGGIFGVLHGKSALEQIKSPWFYLMLLFALVAMLRINYFIATIRTQEEYLLNDRELALKLNSIFDMLLPLGGVVSIPFIGFLLDHTNTLTTLTVLFTTSTAIGIFGLIPNSFTWNLIGIALLVVYRPFYYTVVSDYSSKVFGFETFGTVYGLLSCICGIFNMSQNLLDRWTHTTFNMNPFPINLTLVIFTVLFSVIITLYIRAQISHGPKGERALFSNYQSI
ncbi:fmp42p [Saccharomyces arboricola H-6]|uniref:Fmp42p n=1 Tax=Saccharomyces arboricola (strain H-6 / AS 2.3317 / CBS 10644) TaxID=1160507 RepID=J8Q3D0_SACAR|nr:fmp42p [Saccharomyces arboricola H-6]